MKERRDAISTMAKITHKQPILWKKRILIPFWIIRIILMLFVMAVYAWAIRQIHDDPEVSTRSKAYVQLFSALLAPIRRTRRCEDD